MKVDTLISAVRKLETRAISRPLTTKETRQLESFCTEAWDRMLYAPSKEIFGNQKVIGKHKLPRFMYHITTESAYENMLKEGCIKPSECMDSSKGIFLFDLKNLTRFWTKNKDVVEQPRTTLLSMIADKLGFETSGNIVMLRIPTKDLDARTLRVRVQKLCRCGAGGSEQDFQRMLEDPHRGSNALSSMQYAMQGENVSKVPLYNQRKNAIEYITPSEIPIEKVSFVGKANVDTKSLSEAHEQMKDVPSVWHSLTKGTAEHKAIEHMN